MQTSESSYRRYVIGQLRMARIRARLLINEIDTIGRALKGGWVDPDIALAWLNGDALSLVQCEPAETIEYEATHATFIENGMRADRASEANQTTGNGSAAADGAATR